MSVITIELNIAEKLMAQAYGIPIKDGLKIDCREEELNRLKNDKKLTEKFKLNIKRLNRWWYSIYFESKEKLSNGTNL